MTLKECLQSLKGISVNKISNLTPIKPIITIENNDKDLLSQEIDRLFYQFGINALGGFWTFNKRNLWERIHQMVGEVKVTQSSRDGGVDTIVYDLEPIAVEKKLSFRLNAIQTSWAYRQSEIYMVLLWTEGATKGILVTTSDLVLIIQLLRKDKPITLINGSNLFYLSLKNMVIMPESLLNTDKDELK